MSHITVNVKTFHGKRTVHKIRVSITDPVERIINKLFQIEPEEMGLYHNLKLVMPIGRIVTLQMDQSIEKQRIPHDANLLLLGQKTIVWDTKHKDQNLDVITLSNHINSVSNVCLFVS